MTLPHHQVGSRQKAVWGPRRTALAAILAVCGVVAGPHDALAASGHQHLDRATRRSPVSHARRYRLDDELTARAASKPLGTSRVIVRLNAGAQLPTEFKRYATGRRLRVIDGQVLTVPNALLRQFAAHPSVFRIHLDRDVAAEDYRTTLTVGSGVVRTMLNTTGRGVGVAIIDSGVDATHDDLRPHTLLGTSPVSAFVDFVNGRTTPYDDNGHGTHVAGIIAGNGYDSLTVQSGVAPGASLAVLKVLDANGHGTISGIIAALDWVVDNHARYNIRVVNMSVGANVNESYETDPLTLAAKRVVDAGVVVVAAAGNIGKNAAGATQYGGITAPGNAPWVLTVGASSTMGTGTRSDDTLADFSSRGPTNVDYLAKPDLVAPGVGTISLAARDSLFLTSEARYLLPGVIGNNPTPYLALSGTSMASPVVAGSIALMLEANPALTPNAVKAILEYTAQVYPNYNPLQQGAGFLNTLGAVRLSRFFASAQPGQAMPSDALWSKSIIWGNHLLKGGYLRPDASAWAADTTWGATATAAGDNIVWGSACGDSACDNIVWGSSTDDNIVWGSLVDGDNIVWGSAFDDNIVWGSDCGGGDCDNIVWGSVDASDNTVWGTSAFGDNIVWGSSFLDNIVWGSSFDDNIVWGSSVDDNIVWGSSTDDNIVWGSSTDDNIVWGSSTDGNIVWSNPSTGATWTGTAGEAIDLLSDEVIFGLAPVPPPPAPSPDASGTSATAAIAGVTGEGL